MAGPGSKTRTGFNKVPLNLIDFGNVEPTVGTVLMREKNHWGISGQSSTALRVPTGSNAQRDTVDALPGMIRFNTETNNLEFYDNTTWRFAAPGPDQDNQTALEVPYTVGVAGDWSPVPANVKEALDQLAANESDDQTANQVPFSPSINGNWSPIPNDVREALDQLAQRVIANDGDITSNNNDIASLGTTIMNLDALDIDYNPGGPHWPQVPVNVQEGLDRTRADFEALFTTVANLDTDDIAYTPSNSGNWSPIPSNTSEALDQLAANQSDDQIAVEVAYTPSTPGDWSPVPSNVGEALDQAINNGSGEDFGPKTFIVYDDSMFQTAYSSATDGDVIVLASYDLSYTAPSSFKDNVHVVGMLKTRCIVEGPLNIIDGFSTTGNGTTWENVTFRGNVSVDFSAVEKFITINNCDFEQAFTRPASSRGSVFEYRCNHGGPVNVENGTWVFSDGSLNTVGNTFTDCQFSINQCSGLVSGASQFITINGSSSGAINGFTFNNDAGNGILVDGTSIVFSNNLIVFGLPGGIVLEQAGTAQLQLGINNIAGGLRNGTITPMSVG